MATVLTRATRVSEWLHRLATLLTCRKSRSVTRERSRDSPPGFSAVTCSAVVSCRDDNFVVNYALP